MTFRSKGGKGMPGMVVYTSNVVLWRRNPLDHEFKAGVGYIAEFKVTLSHMRSWVKFLDIDY